MGFVRIVIITPLSTVKLALWSSFFTARGFPQSSTEIWKSMSDSIWPFAIPSQKAGWALDKIKVKIKAGWALLQSAIPSETGDLLTSRLPCYVFCICLLATNKYQKYKSVELGDQLPLDKTRVRLTPTICNSVNVSAQNNTKTLFCY